jgi:hypothetical protein
VLHGWFVWNPFYTLQAVSQKKLSKVSKYSFITCFINFMYRQIDLPACLSASQLTTMQLTPYPAPPKIDKTNTKWQLQLCASFKYFSA